LPGFDVWTQVIDEDRDAIFDGDAGSIRNLHKELSHPSHIVSGMLLGYDSAFQKELPKSAKFQLIDGVQIMHIYLLALG
jgi:hypothetical protein